MGRLRLEITGLRKTGVPELSAVALARGRIYVADDEEGVALLGPKGAKFRGPGVMEGVEGLTADGAGTSLYAVSENSRRLVRLALARGGAIEDAEDLGTLPKLGGRKKCWEGAAWLPRAMSPEKRDRLLLANESAPKALALFDPEDLDDHEVLELPAELEDALDDVSRVASSGSRSRTRNPRGSCSREPGGCFSRARRAARCTRSPCCAAEASSVCGRRARRSPPTARQT